LRGRPGFRLSDGLALDIAPDAVLVTEAGEPAVKPSNVVIDVAVDLARILSEDTAGDMVARPCENSDDVDVDVCTAPCIAAASGREPGIGTPRSCSSELRLL